MKPTVKFALLCGVLAVGAAILSVLSSPIRLSPRGDEWILLSGLAFAVAASLGPYLASRRGWLSSPVSPGRAARAALPLPFLPAAFMVGMIGWGDIQEHLIRALLHACHRDIPSNAVGALIVTGVVGFGAATMSVLLWISISVLAKRWSARNLLILWVGCIILSGLFGATVIALDNKPTAFAPMAAVFAFVCGLLFAFVVEMAATVRRESLVFRLALAILGVAIVGGASLVVARSVPEKRFPALGQKPVWTFDIASTGCLRAWAGPDSSAAANEIAFASSETLGMAFETNAAEHKTCVFSIDVKSGKAIAKISIDGFRPIIGGTPDGNFKVSAGGHEIAFTPALVQLGEPKTVKELKSDSNGKLRSEEDTRKRFLAQYPPNSVLIHPLGSERVLVTKAQEFSVFRSDGTLVSTERFTRESANFAALSADHRRFAVAVYLWGIGDPSYLEEEKIIVYDAETGKAIAAVPSEPLPRTQSWAALSPDGSLLVVGAQSRLRLFRLPQEGRR